MFSLNSPFYKCTILTDSDFGEPEPFDYRIIGLLAIVALAVIYIKT